MRRGLSDILVLAFCALTVVLAGCRPRGILSSRQMRRVMVDLHKTDALLQVYALHYGHDSIEDAAYATVLQRHGITQAQFDSSLVWYTNHPQIFDKIYPKVMAEIEAESKAFDLSHAEELAAPLQIAQPQRLSAEQTREAVDSLLWVNRNGLPSLWHERQAGSPTVRIPYSL